MKRALLVGVDDYDNFSALGGCVSDVAALRPLLARNQDDSPNFECHALTTAHGRVTRGDLISAVDDLLAPGADVALFFFAGHGEESRHDVALVTQDGTASDPGLHFSEFLGKVAASTVREVVIALDCCFAGSAGGMPQLGAINAVLRSGVSLLAASRGDQTSAETAAGGLFSSFLCGALNGGAADVLGKVTVAGVYAYVSESFGAWGQRPTFKANIERPHELRQCSPWVPLASLRRLNEFFLTESAEFPLDSSYEPMEEPHNAEHEAAFAILQKYRAAKLLEPVGEDHLYFAAMNNKSCRLTPLGHLYWRMAKQDRL